MITLERITNALNKTFDKDRTSSWSEESVSLIQSNKQFFGYFSTCPYIFFYELIRELQPNHVVELGNREGLGVLSFHQGIKDNNSGMLSTVDIHNDLRFVPESIKKSNRLNVVFGDVCSDEVLQKIKLNGSIDVILFDTVHIYEQMKKEWVKYEPLLSDVAVVLIDDLNFESKHENSKQRFFDEMENYEKLSDKRIHSSGFGIVIYDRSKTARKNLSD